MERLSLIVHEAAHGISDEKREMSGSLFAQRRRPCSGSLPDTHSKFRSSHPGRNLMIVRITAFWSMDIIKYTNSQEIGEWSPPR